MIKCPLCAEEIQDEAKICRFCNADLISGAAQRPELKSIMGGLIKIDPSKASSTAPAKNSFQSCMGCVGWVIVAFIVLIGIARMSGEEATPIADDPAPAMDDDAPLFEPKENRPTS